MHIFAKQTLNVSITHVSTAPIDRFTIGNTTEESIANAFHWQKAFYYAKEDDKARMIRTMTTDIQAYLEHHLQGE